MKFSDFLLNESQSVVQKLKTYKKEDVAVAQKLATNDIKFNFPAELKTDDLIKWYTLQLILSGDPIRQRINYCKDYIASEINSVNFRDSSFTVEKLEQDNEKWHREIQNSTQIGKPGRLGRTVINFPDGFKWISLDRSHCPIEASHMGHCGNAGSEDGSNILSLRDRQNVPHLTFIVNNGVLGESKGRLNAKPEKKYHRYIIELLKSPLINTIGGGGYAPENNFELDDLTQKQMEDLLKKKPDINNLINLYRGPRRLLSLPDAIEILAKNKEIDTRFSDYDNYHTLGNKVHQLSPQSDDLKINDIIEMAKRKVERGGPVAQVWVDLKQKKHFSKQRINLVKQHINDQSVNVPSFMRYINSNFPNQFKEIYNSLNNELKSKTVIYLFATEAEFDHNLLYDLDDNSAKETIENLTKAGKPIPRQLKFTADYPKKDTEIKKAKIPYGASNHMFKYDAFDTFGLVFSSLAEGKEVDQETRNEFNRLSTIPYKQFVKLQSLHNQLNNIDMFFVISRYNYGTMNCQQIYELYKILGNDEKVTFSEQFYRHIRHRLSLSDNPTNNRCRISIDSIKEIIDNALEIIAYNKKQ